MFNNTYSNIFAAIVSYGKLLSLSTFEVLIKNEFLTPLSMPARQWFYNNSLIVFILHTYLLRKKRWETRLKKKLGMLEVKSFF